MKGTLKNKEGKWVVEFLQKLTNVDTWVKELPLHPDDAKQFETGFTDKFTKEVEFEIVAYGNPCKYHKNLLDCKNPPNCDCEFNYVAKLITKQGSFDEDGFAITRVIDDKQETTTSWDKIYENFKKEWQDDVDLLHWLKENYHPPVKK